MFTEKETRSFLPIFHENYTPPSPELIKKVIRLLGFNQEQVARITGVSYTKKGSGSVRRWCTALEDKNHREIDSAKWRLLVEAADLGTTQDSMELITR